MGTLVVVLAVVITTLVTSTAYSLPSHLISNSDRSALFSFLIAMGFNDECVASALDTCGATRQESHSTTLVPSADRSLLIGLFRDLGFSETCVSSALDACAGVQQEGQLEALLKEARDLQQEERDLQHEERDLQREERDLQEEERDLQRQGTYLQQQERDLQQETRDLLQETRNLLQDLAYTVNNTQNKPRHCKDLLDDGYQESGVHVIYPYPGQPDRRLRVYCDQVTDGGGWTTFQRRTNTAVREDFYRTWFEYVLGFGNIEEEFWLGLDNLHTLTSTEPQELRIDLADWDGGQRYAKYGFFYVGDRDTKYLLSALRYSGDAGNNLAWHSGRKFSTHDNDNDDAGTENCAEKHRGAWWYTHCHHSNLNGYQYENNPSEEAKGINWLKWRGYKYSLRHTAMMVRPAMQN